MSKMKNRCFLISTVSLLLFSCNNNNRQKEELQQEVKTSTSQAPKTLTMEEFLASNAAARQRERAANPLLGEWENEDKSLSITFYSENRFIMFIRNEIGTHQHYSGIYQRKESFLYLHVDAQTSIWILHQLTENELIFSVQGASGFITCHRIH